VSEVYLSALVSTLLIASSVVILPTPKWVQYKNQHRKVDARELTVVHRSGQCVFRRSRRSSIIELEPARWPKARWLKAEVAGGEVVRGKMARGAECEG
jgi:hypothetical protein